MFLRNFNEACNQELFHAALYRLLHDERSYVCPVKQQRYEVREDPDSTFDFRSGQPEADEGEHQFPLNCDEYQSNTFVPGDLTMSDTDKEHSVADSDQGLSDWEETWEASADKTSFEEVVQSQLVKSILFSLSVFLNLFQLVFSISERAQCMFHWVFHVYL